MTSGKRACLRALTAFSAAAIGTVGAPAATAASAPTTSGGDGVVAHVLPNLPGYMSSVPTLISRDGGSIAGQGETTMGATHAIRWTSTGASRVDSPLATASTPFGVNDRGEIVGQETLPHFGTVGFVDFPGKPSSRLGTAGRALLPLALDDAGDIAVETATDPAELGVVRHGVYSRVAPITGRLANLSMDDTGDIAAEIDTSTAATIVLWLGAAGTTMTLAPPPGQTIYSLASISDNGIVAATTGTATGLDVAEWRPGDYATPVAAPVGAGQSLRYTIGSYSHGQAVNNYGEIVGEYQDGPARRAFAWAGGPGATLTAPAGSIADPTYVNDRGVVGGTVLMPQTSLTVPVLWIDGHLIRLAADGFSTFDGLSDRAAIGYVTTFDLTTGAETDHGIAWTIPAS